ncbi:MAG: 50S ribosomal protein L19 [Nitrospiria bacterium]
MNRLEQLEQGLLKKDAPKMKIGDTVRVHVKIKEGDKERVQIYEGVVIRKKGGSNRETFTVRKVSYGVGVERIFPFHSPSISKVETIREGKVRRAKLYYIRNRTGRAARITEKEQSFTSPKKKALATKKPT